jgi:ABC-type antimicrobial peptide transport system permease subunit
MLADLDLLLWHLNLVSPTSTIAPNEVFIKGESGAGQWIRESPINLDTGLDILHGDLVHDRESMLNSVRRDPLISAGWETVVLLSAAVIVLTSGLGYVTYLLAFARRSRMEMGTLKSIGFSLRQISGLLATEHLIVTLVGVGLGTWAGFQMSTLMVSSVTVTENGMRVVPPFELTTDWSFMLPIYGAMSAIFLVSLLRLALGLRKMDLQSVSRMEG